MALDRLFSPGRIGSLELRNRILMAPMGSNLGELDGTAGARLRRYYEERARGGAGLLLVGVGAVSYPAGAAIPRQLGLSDDRFLPGLRALSDAIHQHGARAAVQLQHAGKIATRDIGAGRPLLVPSVLPYSGGGMEDLTADEVERLVSNLRREGAALRYHELGQEDIAALVDDFADAGLRARRAGFDAVEIHAGHGYVISSFLSRASNLREDAYGGSAENRARLLVEVIRAVKQRAGADFPVWCRMDAREYRIENGITLEESCRTAQLAAAAGADALHVSAYGNPMSGIAFTEAPLVHEPGGYLGFAARIKQQVDVPVIAVGRISPERAERALRRGEADFIAMGRKLIADPELPRKLAEGRADEIRPCVYCYTCVGKIFVNESVVCAVNAAAGREAELELDKAETPRRVLVVGGGPAGMEAARVAALRGHRVTLVEQASELGGTLRFAALCYPPNGELLRYLERQLETLGVEVRLGCKATPELVAELAPDATVVATGAQRGRSELPGADARCALSVDELRALLAGRGSALAGVRPGARLLLRALRLAPALQRPALLRRWTKLWLPLGRRVVVIGGGAVGVALAGFLADRGRRVVVLESSPWLAPELAIPRRWRALHELREQGVDLRTGVRVERISDGAVATLAADGTAESLPADHVLLADMTRPDRALAEGLSGQPTARFTAGDCDGPGYLQGAIEDGHRSGREV